MCMTETVFDIFDLEKCFDLEIQNQGSLKAIETGTIQ